MSATSPAPAAQSGFDGDSVVKVTNLVAGYIPGVNILNGCSIEARKGELIGIIGPNGAGKSTLLKAMFGLVKVHSGSVVVRGQDITGLKANKLVTKGVGFVPQTNNVFAALTIEENLQMGMFQRLRDLPPGGHGASWRTSSRSWRSGGPSAPVPSPAANARWSPWAGP